LSSRIQSMDKIFHPRSIAFVGASNNIGKWGGIILYNLKSGGYEGKIYPVNPKEQEIGGMKVYRRVSDIPGKVDLAIFTIPAAAMPDAISDCVAKGVPAGVVVTAGFAELGEEGKALEKDMVEKARKGGMVLIGPNGQGISSPYAKLHPWMPMFKPDPGVVGIASQSGNVVTFIAEGLAEFGFGCSKAVSAGNCADIDFVDYLDYFRQDPDTRVVVLYVEGVRDGRRFLEATKKTSLEKPVVVIKSGRTAVGKKAAATHTGALSGSDDAFTAALAQAGAVRAYSIEQSVMYAAAFVGSALPKGPRVGIITGGGGLGVLAADVFHKLGLELPELSDKVIKKLHEHLPPWWNPNNPVDLVAGIGYGGPKEIIPILMEDNGIDGLVLLGIGWMYSMFDAVNRPTDFSGDLNPGLKERMDGDMKYCEILCDYAIDYDKPLLMTSNVARLAIRRHYPGLMGILKRNIMLFPTIDDAALSYKALYDRAKFLKKVR
jgi:acyl-CoA synthetase (NDP forming)